MYDLRMNLSFFLIRICFNPRALAGGRDNIEKSDISSYIVSIHASSRENATLCPVCLFVAGHVSIPVPLQSRNLAISQSRNLAIMDCSLQAAGERKVKTMAKICQAETAIRGSLRVHDKRKPLNARRMPMHSFVSTPLQGTLDPME